MSSKDRDQIWDEWGELVNMAPKELEEFLETDESQSVGADSGDGESTGHKSGTRIVEIRNTNKSELSDDDWDHMAKVVGYVKRHVAQGGPDEDVEHSKWRYSLMKLGPRSAEGRLIRAVETARPLDAARPDAAASPVPFARQEHPCATSTRWSGSRTSTRAFASTRTCSA